MNLLADFDPQLLSSLIGTDYTYKDVFPIMMFVYEEWMWLYVGYLGNIGDDPDEEVYIKAFLRHPEVVKYVNSIARCVCKIFYEGWNKMPRGKEPLIFAKELLKRNNLDDISVDELNKQFLKDFQSQKVQSRMSPESKLVHQWLIDEPDLVDGIRKNDTYYS